MIGLDLSLRASGACVIPVGWGARDLRGLKTAVFGEPLSADASEEDHVRRYTRIVDGIRNFVDEHAFGVGDGGAVFAEAYAFRQRSSSAHRAAELGGAVKVGLYLEFGAPVLPIIASSARKLLLGKCPRDGAKAFAHRNVRRFWTLDEWTGDEVDAFVVANAGRAALGLRHMSIPGT